MFCQKCGKEIPNDSNVCQFCGAPQVSGSFPQQPSVPAEPKKKKKKKGCLIAVIVVALIAVFFIALGSSSDEPNVSDDKVSTSAAGNASTTKKDSVAETTVSEKDYKASCESIAYKDIARNPDSYAGKNVKFKGEVIQVQEGWGNSVIYRIDVTQDEYGYWDDTVYVTYELPDGAPRILEDDIVTFYGECKGTKSYTSVMGGQITIPEVDAHYIVIDQ
ncbi:MAG: zinc ribbon domain-containing protein [Ruminococcus sp.]|nr:zinc ribbon domain-containing protein [Ruminococcus sp.]